MTQFEWQTLALTLRVAALAVAIALLPALLTAWALVFRIRFHTALSVAANLPLALPPVAIGWLLLILCGAQGPVGIWLANRYDIHLAYTTEGAALACAIMVLPLMVSPLRAAFDAYDRDATAIARTLGATSADAFVSVTLPLVAPGLLLALVTGFTASCAQFGAVITFAASLPGQTQTLPLAIFAALQTAGGQTAAARLALLSIALALFGLLAAERLRARMQR